MNITGIICEYNPLHLGHKKQLDWIRANQNGAGIVCLMSGNYVQRGQPAIIDKSLRAKAAILSGADLVLELPVTAALSSAEGFAAEGVRILGGFCQNLCFGAETADAESLLSTASTLLSPAFSEALHTALDTGLSFPAARQAALEAMGANVSLLTRPNDILAVEYCKAILSQQSSMLPMPIRRQGDYHSQAPDPKNPSATALRTLMTGGGDWKPYVSEELHPVFSGATLHTLAAGQRSILSRLRTMDDEAFKALPFGSEGLWRKLMHACRQYATLEEILTAVKSKRYTRTRLDRMVMCAFLGITNDQISVPAPYVRVLAINDRGRQILNEARKTGTFINAGQTVDHPYQELETKCGRLYGLFAEGAPETPDTEAKRRIFYLPTE